MQRLQAWLMPGLACFTLSVALIALALNPKMPRSAYPTLELISFGLMAIGSIFVIAGVVVVVTIPFLRWRFGRMGKLYRILGRQIKSGQRLLFPDSTEAECIAWKAATRSCLTTYFGGDWHKEVRGFDSRYHVETVIDRNHRNMLIAQQVDYLYELRQRLRDMPDTYFLFNANT